MIRGPRRENGGRWGPLAEGDAEHGTWALGGGSPALGMQQRVPGSGGECAKALGQVSWQEEMGAPPGVLVRWRVVGMGNREVDCSQDTLEEESGGAGLRWGLGREDP